MAGKTTQLKFQMLQDAHPLRIEAAPGSSATLVVSMTSVGTSRNEWPPKEFVKIASRSGLNHVMCITDISRSWMNGPGLLERITEAIETYALDHQITEIIGVGTSMGAYNLLVQGCYTPFKRIIALSPQFSVHPEIVPEEKRWNFFRKKIVEWPHPDISKLPEAPCEIVMFHGDTEDEQIHWRRIPKPSNLHHFIFPDSDHNFPKRLHSAGRLERMIGPASRGQKKRMIQEVADNGAVTRAEYEQRFGA